MFQTIFIAFSFFCLLFWNLEGLTPILICLQFYDLLNIFDLNGLPSEENPYLFNGDFVDRGSFSLEVILTLFAFKCMSPSGIPSAILLLFVFSAWALLSRFGTDKQSFLSERVTCGNRIYILLILVFLISISRSTFLLILFMAVEQHIFIVIFKAICFWYWWVNHIWIQLCLSRSLLLGSFHILPWSWNLPLICLIQPFFFACLGFYV